MFLLKNVCDLNIFIKKLINSTIEKDDETTSNHLPQLETQMQISGKNTKHSASTSHQK